MTYVCMRMASAGQRVPASSIELPQTGESMAAPLPADAPDLTQVQLEGLRKVAASRPASTRGQFVLPDDVHDVLVDKGYIRWERGILLVTPSGILALARDLTESPCGLRPVP